MNRRIYEQRDFGLADGFQYDATDQIIGYQREGTLDVGAGTVSSATASSLQFDGAGNRTQITGSFEQNTYIRNKLNQYTDDAAGPGGYDPKGNLAMYAGWTVTYDAVNRLTELSHPASGQLISYRYDVLNRRIAQKVNGVVTSHVYDNWNLIEERPTDGRQPHCYLFGGASNELVVSFGSGYPNYWYFQDGRGNTSHLTDNEHIVIERYTYTFDGRVSYSDGNNSIPSSLVDNRFLFAGAILLPETQLYDMRNRIYYPRWGRFLQTDPIGFKGDASNLYRYCVNNPVNLTDPDGLVAGDIKERMTSLGGGDWIGNSRGLSDGHLAQMREDAGSNLSFGGVTRSEEKKRQQSMGQRAVKMLAELTPRGHVSQTGVITDGPPHRVGPVDEKKVLVDPFNQSRGWKDISLEKLRWRGPEKQKIITVHYHSGRGKYGEPTEKHDLKILSQGPMYFSNRDWAAQGIYQILRQNHRTQTLYDRSIIPPPD